MGRLPLFPLLTYCSLLLIFLSLGPLHLTTLSKVVETVMYHPTSAPGRPTFSLFGYTLRLHRHQYLHHFTPSIPMPATAVVKIPSLPPLFMYCLPRLICLPLHPAPLPGMRGRDWTIAVTLVQQLGNVRMGASLIGVEKEKTQQKTEGFFSLFCKEETTMDWREHHQ